MLLRCFRHAFRPARLAIVLASGVACQDASTEREAGERRTQAPAACAAGTTAGTTAATSCQSATAPAGTANQVPAAGTPQVGNSPDLTAVPTGGAVPSATAVDEASVPSYMWKRAEAMAITTLVEPFRAMPPEQLYFPPKIPNYETTRAAIQGFLGRAMALPRLAPGRRFDVHLEEDPSLNAAADGYQQIYINTGTLQRSPARDTLFVLCHEIAHSALNHSAKDLDILAADPALQAATNARDAYLAAHYDQNTMTYTHDLAAYQTAARAFDAARQKLSFSSLRVEAQADLVGSMICATLGMPAAEFEQANIEFTRLAVAQAGGGSDQSPPTYFDMPNGERIDGIAYWELEALLFYYQTHPSDPERAQQIQRTRDIADRFLSTSLLAKEWAANVYPPPTIALTDEPPSPKTVTTSSGRVIIVPRPKCGHRH